MGAKVVVIEDEPDIRFLASMILTGAGHAVREAGTGQDGLAAMDEEAPDLVLLDIRLPDMEGWEVLRQARLKPELASLPIVIMSAHSSGHTLERARAAGSSGYLVKPFKHEDLLALVEEHVPGAPPRST